MEQLTYGDRSLSLHRFPLIKNDRLRAWDAADEYLLRDFRENTTLAAHDKLLLVNDTFGALSVALHQHQLTTWGDSFLGWQALRHNLGENGLRHDEPVFVPADQTPDGPFALALIKLPKSLSFFEDQLLRLRRCLRPDALVVTGGMIKHTPRRAYQLLQEIIGETQTSLGWKKARLAHSRLAERPGLATGVPAVSYLLPGTTLPVANLPNVFSRTRPDAGTRLLLAHLPQTTADLAVVDLGCGNGILAMALAGRCPGAHILGVDESFQAVASARLNAAALGPDEHRLVFVVADGLTDEATNSRDLVLCNPPFHQGQVTGDQPAWTMFKEARRVLRPGGELRVVGNRHLGYHAKLQRLFDRVNLVASDQKFVVLSAVSD